MSGTEPGWTRWEVESELASLEDDLRTDPGEALADLLELAERTFATAVIDVHAPEPAGALAYARDLVRLAESGGEIPNDDAFAAAARLRDLVRATAEQDAWVEHAEPLEELRDDPAGPAAGS